MEARNRLELGMFTPPSAPAAPAWFGALFAAVGALLCLAAAGALPLEPSGPSAPRWVLALCGAIFGLPGLFLVAQALRARALAASREGLRRERPDEPWLWEHAWDEQQAPDDGGAQVVRGIAMLAFLALFATPFHWLVWNGGVLMLPFALGCAVLDLVCLALLVRTLRRALQRLRFGTTLITFESFPVWLGERLALQWHGPAQDRFRRIVFTLRCVATHKPVNSDGEAQHTWYRQAWSQEHVIERPELSRRSQPVELVFDPPADQPPTALRLHEPWFWVLSVHGSANGGIC